MNLTDNEKMVLPQLVERFPDGTVSEESHYVYFQNLSVSITARQFSGVMSSLNKKGIIVSTRGVGFHEIKITRTGIDLLRIITNN